MRAILKPQTKLLTVEVAARAFRGLTKWEELATNTSSFKEFHAEVTPTRFLQTIRTIFPDAFLMPKKYSTGKVEVKIGPDEFSPEIVLTFWKKRVRIEDFSEN